jgi:hypothetical protein
MDDERQVDVESARTLDASAAESGVQRPHGTDVGAIEKVVLNAHDGVISVVRTAGLCVQKANLPPPEDDADPVIVPSLFRR